ncbi:energy-coupling factor transporter transmembrane protein EcfT [Cohnella sp. AR92]|uniref:energy-coupling factor transporter transmembrane component T family protein n=1 Tax=Cohnella sp. AR92 TaxID=648716 RepID=UPI000F8F4A2B|nr:energy-coupling factor transporter transmembrane component T [Cohnella sp. AR92]RUS47078.1 energy-coupling factor transporter transmembrane protein EcfT [Cohnella sp. AR92]
MKFNGYVNKRTLLHRIDPRIKLIWFVGTTVLTVVFKDLLVMALLIASSVALWTISGLLREAGGIVRKLLPLLLMAMVTWLVIGAAENGGGTALVALGTVRLEASDVTRAVVSALRIFLMVTSFYSLIMVTNFSEMIYGLRQFRIPLRAAFMCGLVFQIIPIMISEFRTIADAQRARGLELDKGGIVSRIRRYSIILFPLFIRSIQAGQNIALSMHLYRLEFTRNRSSYRSFRITGGDARFSAAFLLLWAIAVLIGTKYPLQAT